MIRYSAGAFLADSIWQRRLCKGHRQLSLLLDSFVHIFVELESVATESRLENSQLRDSPCGELEISSVNFNANGMVANSFGSDCRT